MAAKHSSFVYADAPFAPGDWDVFGTKVVSSRRPDEIFGIQLHIFGLPSSWKETAHEQLASVLRNFSAPSFFSSTALSITPHTQFSVFDASHRMYLQHSRIDSIGAGENKVIAQIWASENLYLKSVDELFFSKVKTYTKAVLETCFQHRFYTEDVAKNIKDPRLNPPPSTEDTYNYFEGLRLFKDRKFLIENKNLLSR